MRIFIVFNGSGIERKLDVPENITIEELRDEFFPRIGLSHYRGPIIINDNDDNEEEIFGGRLSDYDIEDGDKIIVLDDDYKEKMLEKHEIIAIGVREIKNESTHICPYGCGRQVPNEFKGCTELLQARPNYYG